MAYYPDTVIFYSLAGGEKYESVEELKMKNLIKSLWIPIVTSISIICIFIVLWIIPGVFIALFESDWLMYIWYELFLATIVGATSVIIKSSEKMHGNYKLIYYLISFLIISNTYYGLGKYGLFVNLFYM